MRDESRPTEQEGRQQSGNCAAVSCNFPPNPYCAKQRLWHIFDTGENLADGGVFDWIGATIGTAGYEKRSEGRVEFETRFQFLDLQDGGGWTYMKLISTVFMMTH